MIILLLLLPTSVFYIIILRSRGCTHEGIISIIVWKFIVRLNPIMHIQNEITNNNNNNIQK